MDDSANIFREMREEAKLTIQDVSEKTKIRPHIIRFIEEGKFDQLPPVYGKSFLRTYAKLLNIEEELYIEAIEVLSKKEIKPVPIIIKNNNGKENLFAEKISDYKKIFKKESKVSFNKTIINVVIYVGILVALLALLYITFYTGESNKMSELEVNSPQASDTAVIDEGGSGLLSFFEKPDSLTLSGKATDTSWIRIEIDGNVITEVLMLPGMKRDWKAKEFFILNQGNVGAISFSLNGKQLEDFGNAGSVVKNVKITETEIVKPEPWKLRTKQKDRKEIKRIDPSPLEQEENKIRYN